MQTVLIDLQLGYFRHSNGKKRHTPQSPLNTTKSKFQSHNYVFLKLYAEEFVMSKKPALIQTEKKSY